MFILTFLGRTSIRGRVLGGFGLLLALLIAIAVTDDQDLRAIGHQVDSIDRATLASDRLIEFARSVVNIRRQALIYLRSGKAEDLAPTEAGLTALDQDARKLGDIVGPEVQPLITGAAAYRERFEALVADLKKESEAGLAINTLGATASDAILALAQHPAMDDPAYINAAFGAYQAIETLIKSGLHYQSGANPADLAAIAKAKAQLDQTLSAANALANAQSFIIPALNHIPASRDKLLSAIDALVAANAAFDTDLDAAIKTGLAEGTEADRLRTKFIDLRDQEMHKAEARVSNAIVTGILTAGLALLLGLALAILVGTTISALIIRITAVMSRLAGGDLSVTIPDTGRRDQIGDMARAVEVFKANALRIQQVEAAQEQARLTAERDRKLALATLAAELEHSVKKIADAVSQSAVAMRASARTMADAAEQTKTRSSTVAAASDEASINVQTVASAAEELAASIREIGRQASSSAEIAGRAALQAADTNTTMAALAEAADRIGAVVKLISDIASQTNLLALNATIEAARAGEAGKGFAVVASEVKNLAGQTARATEDISAQIATIQEQTRAAVDALRNIESVITEINDIASSTANAVDQQSAATDEIARNVQKAAAGTGAVSSNIDGVLEAAAETGQQAQSVLDQSGTLSQQAQGLENAVQSFLDEVRAA